MQKLIVIAFLLPTIFGCNEVIVYSKKNNPVTAELEKKEVTVEAFHISWGCACANWMNIEDFRSMNRVLDEDGVYDCEALGTCFNIEPLDSSLKIPDIYWTDSNSTKLFRFKGRFYKEHQPFSGHDNVTLYARKFQYTSYEYIGPKLEINTQKKKN